MPQVVPMEVPNFGFKNSAVKPMTPILERLSRPRGTKHTSSLFALRAHNPQGGYSSII
jgi:hypothetical protein